MKSEDLNEVTVIFNSRLGICEVCGGNEAKYTCPECEVKTCSLQCVKIHKKELECSGIRNKVKFKPLCKMNNLDLQSDYSLLESATRAVDGVFKNAKNLNKMNFYSMTRMKIRNAAHKRNIDLQFLPRCFLRHKENTTYYHWKSDKLFWKVQWVFPEAEMLSINDEKVPESQLIVDALHKFIDVDKCNGNFKKCLKPYIEVDKNIIKVLLKLEKCGTKKFFEVDKNDSLVENLSQQSIIEHPVFYVIFEASSFKYDIIKRDNNRSSKFSNNYKGINLLFDPCEAKNNSTL